MTAGDVITRASGTLQDVAGVRWTVAELLRYIGDAQRRVCSINPSAYVNTVTTNALIPGSTKQPVPATCRLLLDITRNMGTSGTTPGRAIRRIDRATLDADVPNWHVSPVATDKSGIEHYAYEPDLDPNSYWVYPVPAAGTSIRVAMIIALQPSDPTSANDPLVINDTYHECIQDYVIARAIMKDAETGVNLQRAQTHAQQFMTAIGAGGQTIAAT